MVLRISGIGPTWRIASLFDGGADVEPDWVSRMFDSPEAVAISDTAVYVGGHMRWAMAPGTLWTDFTDGNTNEQPEGTVVRDQIMAISPIDGTALDWDPGAGGVRGAAITLTAVSTVITRLSVNARPMPPAAGAQKNER